MPTNDHAVIYQSRTGPPAVTFDPGTAGFPWPRQEVPVRRPQRQQPAAGVIDFSAATAGAPVFDPGTDGYPWPRTERPPTTKRPNTPTGYITLGNDEYVPFEEKTHSWLPVFPDFARTRKPNVNTGISVLQLTDESFLGSPHLSWWRQPSEPIVKVRRPNVNVGLVVFGNDEYVPFADKTVSWLPIFPVKIDRRKPLVNEGRSVMDFTELVDPVDFLPTFPSRVHARKPLVNVGFFVNDYNEFINSIDPVYTLLTRPRYPDYIDRRKPLVNTGQSVVDFTEFINTLDPVYTLLTRPRYPDYINRRKPIVNEGRVVRGVPTDQFLGDPYISWYRQPVERPAVRRRPLVNTGFFALGTEEFLPIAARIPTWLPQYPHIIDRRKPLVNEGRSVLRPAFFDPSTQYAVRPVFPDYINRRKPNVWEYFTLYPEIIILIPNQRDTFAVLTGDGTILYITEVQGDTLIVVQDPSTINPGGTGSTTFQVRTGKSDILYINEDDSKQFEV